MKHLIGCSLLALGLHFGIANAHHHNEIDHASELTRATHAGVTYVNGGIGKDQQEALQGMRKEFNLQTTFATKSGEYIADVNIHIHKGSKKVLEVENMGPIFMAKLAPGNYQIKVTYDGKTQTKNVTVNKHGMRSLNFYW